MNDVTRFAVLAGTGLLAVTGLSTYVSLSRHVRDFGSYWHAFNHWIKKEMPKKMKDNVYLTVVDYPGQHALPCRARGHVCEQCGFMELVELYSGPQSTAERDGHGPRSRFWTTLVQVDEYYRRRCAATQKN